MYHQEDDDSMLDIKDDLVLVYTECCAALWQHVRAILCTRDENFSFDSFNGFVLIEFVIARVHACLPVCACHVHIRV